jgi:peptide deformylase
MQIYTFPYPTLNTESTSVNWFMPPAGYSDWLQFEKEYIYLMLRSNGIGLAANQIGIAQRFFAMGHDSFDVFSKPAILYNARIIKTSEEVEIGEEGCLSFPNVFYNVYRAVNIEVEWQTMKGATEGATLRGLEARCFQHELDHINGVTFNLKAEELIN